MPFTFIKNLHRAVRNAKTYRVGLVQAKAYRFLKQHMSLLLLKHGITTIEWALLGVLFDSLTGTRMNAVATELGVEVPFVTVMAKKLSRAGYIDTVIDARDARAKLLTLSSKGRAFVEKNERELRDDLRPLLKGVSIPDLMAYMKVLEKIIENATMV